MAGLRAAVYCTLLLSDRYLPGAMVLAHSLRDNGTKAKIVALVTLDRLQPSTIDELKTIYDDVIPINRIINESPANLYLMNRPDLIATFSKIELWRQTQYRQIVYLDADAIALRAPDELLTLDTSFAAVPDIGWPDCFNTGVMVLRPNLQDYYSLLALAQRGVSFDGADQGLLNMHFRQWQRLSFTYNCTPSGHYQYIPAFQHFQSTISIVHYIGQRKPWNLPRQVLPLESPYSQLLGRWWATYDRHYRPEISVVNVPASPEKEIHIAQHYGPEMRSVRQPEHAVKISGPSVSRGLELQRPYAKPPHTQEATHLERLGPVKPVHVSAQFHAPVVTPSQTPPHFEAHPVFESVPHFATAPHFEGAQAAPVFPLVKDTVAIKGPAIPETIPSHSPRPSVLDNRQEMTLSVVPQYVHGEEHVSVWRQSGVILPRPPPTDGSQTPPPVDYTQQPDFHPPEIIEATNPPERGRASPPQEVVPSTVFPEPSSSPPKVEWDASREPPPVNSKPEAHNLPTHTYTMSQDTQLFQPPKSYPEAPRDMYYEVPATQPAVEMLSPIFPWEAYAPKPTRVFLDEGSEPDAIPLPSLSPPGSRDSQEAGDDSVISEMPRMPRDLWQTYIRSNVWDEVPEIERYIQAIQRPRRANVQVISGAGSVGKEGSSLRGPRWPSMKLTDFPTEAERPSLPVTPAPIRRPNFLIRERDEYGDLPAAEGVPIQEEWNPLARLEELQHRQCEFLERPPLLCATQIPRRQMPGGEPEGNCVPSSTASRGTYLEAPRFASSSFVSASLSVGNNLPEVDPKVGPPVSRT